MLTCISETYRLLEDMHDLSIFLIYIYIYTDIDLVDILGTPCIHAKVNTIMSLICNILIIVIDVHSVAYNYITKIFFPQNSR